MSDLDYATAARLLRANFNTGKLYWLPRTPDIFEEEKHTRERTCSKWNARFAGKEAFSTRHTKGYLSGAIFGRGYRAHRVLWLLHTGKWPSSQIDHINGDKADNRLVNLREVTNEENSKNQKIRVNNTSGVHGVFWNKRNKKWQAMIGISGGRKHLGFFAEKEDAATARKAAEIKYGFHENHGRGVE
jgi:hypothetical protein